MVTLLASGCPPAAIVAAFGLDARTVVAWQWQGGRASRSTRRWCSRRALGQVQADELRVKRQEGVAWRALAVPSRLWVGGVVSAQRDGALAGAPAAAALVRRAADQGALLWSADGWRPSLQAIGWWAGRGRRSAR